MKKLLIVLFTCSTFGLLYSMTGPETYTGMFGRRGLEKGVSQQDPQKRYASLLRSYRNNPSQLAKDIAVTRQALQMSHTRVPGAARALQHRLQELEAIQAELSQAHS
jgi:hypothetical protein